MSPYIPLRLIQEVRDRARETCEYCLLPQSSQEATFHIDHIVPRREGGETDVANLALACVTWSLRKGARMFAIDPQTQATVRLFHPRDETWSEHFLLNEEFEFEGLSQRTTLPWTLSACPLRINSVSNEQSQSNARR